MTTPTQSSPGAAPSAPPSMDQIKQGMRASWMAGDFGRIAAILPRIQGEGFITRLRLQPGTRLLDIACGTGNQSLPAAHLGATVTGLDLAPNLLEQARERAEAAGLPIRFIEGDAEELPFPDASFDVVLSMFGAMFAPRPERVAAEMLRVCRPGGLIAMGNWTPGSFTGQMFRLTAQHAPPPPGIPAPVLWGDPAVVAERFGHGARVTSTVQQLTFDYPFGPAAVVDFFRQYFGPLQMTFSRLDPAAQQRLYDDLVQLWTSHNQGTPDHTLVPNEFLEVHAERLA